jgi:outer membrane protein assembly factor BamB
LIKEKDFTVPGDSLFTDLTIDRNRGILYIHQLNSTSGDKGGKILVLDTNGTKIKEMNSPATNYPIGIELVDGKLLIGDRDGKRKLYIIDPETGTIEAEKSNPFQEFAGPRGICYDGSDFVYQVCTAFPGNTLTSAWIIKLHKSDLEKPLDSIALESMEGLINARGIDLDPIDKNFWITDFNGNIYKIAGFETITNVQEQKYNSNTKIMCNIYPNPISSVSNCAFKSEAEGKLRVVATDVLGRIVNTLFESNISINSHYNFTIDAQNFSNGIYNLSFILNGQKILEKMVIVMK